MICTTLNKIREHSPCADSWARLLTSLGKTAPDDEPLPMEYILDTLNFDDCLWAMRSLPERSKEWRFFAADCAEQVLPIFERCHPTDTRPRDAITAARAFARGEIDAAARAAAGAAAREWQAAHLRKYLREEIEL